MTHLGHSKQPDHANSGDDPPAANRIAARPWYRLHASTYVVLLLTLAVLFLLNVPGQRTLELALSPGGGAREQLKLEQSGVFYSRFLGGHIAVSNRIVHGWPRTWLVRDDVGGYEDPVPRSTSIWSFREDLRHFHPGRLIANIVVAVVLTAAFGLLFERWRRRRRRLWQQTIGDWLMLVAVVGAATAFGLNTARDYREERAALLAMRYLTPEMDLFMLNRRTSGGPSWLQEILGRWWRPWFERTVHLEIPPEHLPHLSSFRQLRALAVYDLRLPDERLTGLGDLKKLELLHLTRAGFLFLRDAADDATSDKSVAQLLGNLVGLDRLESLRLDAGTFGDESSQLVAALRNLRILVVDDAAALTDDGLAALAKCKKLEVLNLGIGNRITSAGFRHLASRPHLEFLSLPDSVDLEAVDDLQRHLPELKIEVGGELFVAEEW